MAFNNSPAILAIFSPSVSALDRPAAEALQSRIANALDELHGKGGALDALILVGSLTAQAAEDDFAQLDELVDAIILKCHEAPKAVDLPVVIASPGVTDGIPLPSGRATARALGPWWPEMREAFWRGEVEDALEAVRESFRAFERWFSTRRPSRDGWSPGLLPGDGSTIISTCGLSIRLVTLNGVFRTIFGKTDDSLVELSPEQLNRSMSVASGAPHSQEIAVVATSVSSPFAPATRTPLINIAAKHGLGSRNGWFVGAGLPTESYEILLLGRDDKGTSIMTALAASRTITKREGSPAVGSHIVVNDRATLETAPPKAVETRKHCGEAIASGRAILVYTSGAEDLMRSIWGVPLGGPDGLQQSLAKNAPADAVRGSLDLPEILALMYREDAALVDRTIEGEMIVDQPAVNEILWRLLSAPWARIYDFSGTNILTGVQEAGNASLAIVNARVEAPSSRSKKSELVAMNGIPSGASHSRPLFEVEAEGVHPRALWFNQFRADLITNPIVFTSSSVTSPNLWRYLSLMPRPGNGRPAGQAAFLVAPDEDQTSAWRLGGYDVGHIQLSLSNFIREELRPGLQTVERGARLLARSKAEISETTGVKLVSGLLDRAGRGDAGYLRGADPSWGDIKDGVPARLSTVDALHDKAALNHTPRPILILSDRSGTGKSTSLMQFGSELKDLGFAVGWLDREANRSTESLLTEAGELDLDVVLVDDVDIFGAKASRIVRCLNRSGKTLVVATIRTTRADLLDDKSGFVLMKALHLTYGDLEQLVDRLEANRQLGELKRFNPKSARIERLQQLSRRDLMAAMVEAITGHRFEKRVRSEYQQLSTLAGDVYATVCLFDALQYEDRKVTLQQNALLQIVSSGAPDPFVNDAIEDLVRKGLLLRRGSGQLTCRHRVVAEEVVTVVKQSEARFTELYRSMLEFYVQRSTSITDRNDPYWRAMVALMNHRVMVRSGLRPETVRGIYHSLHGWLSDNFHYWLQCGSYEVEKGDVDLAANYLEAARACEGGGSHFKVVTAWGLVCLRRAASRPADQALHDKAVEAVAGLETVALQYGTESPHTFVALVREGTEWLKRSGLLGNEDARSIARRIVHVLDQGAKVIPDNPEFAGNVKKYVQVLRSLVAGDDPRRQIPL